MEDTPKQVVTTVEGSVTSQPKFNLKLDTGKFQLSVEGAVAVYNLCLDPDLGSNDEYTHRRKNTTESAYVLAKVTLESNDKVCSYCSGKIRHEPRFELYQVQTLIGLFHETCVAELAEEFEQQFMQYPHVVLPSII